MVIFIVSFPQIDQIVACRKSRIIFWRGRKLLKAIGTKGASYSTLRAISCPNKDYVAYLIGVLNCPALQKRIANYE
jgi:hypothetical protein